MVKVCILIIVDDVDTLTEGDWLDLIMEFRLVQGFRLVELSSRVESLV